MPLHHAEGDKIVKHIEQVVLFTDGPSAISLGILPVGFVTRVYAFMDTEFDAVGATISMGTVAQPQNIFDTSAINLALTTNQSIEPFGEIKVQGEHVLDFDGGAGGSQGQVTILIEYTGTPV